jgi:cell division protease FtsH
VPKALPRVHRTISIGRPRSRATWSPKWGLSDKLGPLTYSEEEQEVFLGHSVTQHKSVSDETTHLIDEEIRNVIERNYERARGLLVANIDKLHAMSAALMKYETIDAVQIDDIMSGRPPRPPSDWDDEETGGRPAGRRSGGQDAAEPGKGSDEGTLGRPASEH